MPLDALEVALPELVAREARQRRMQHARDVVAAFQPLRDVKRALLMVLQPHAHGAQAAQHLVGIVGRAADAERDVGLVQLLPMLALAETVPIRTSEWPAGYFVAAWIEMSTPKSSGRK